MKSKTVGDRVKKFMAGQKINQSHLAVQSGIPQSNISAMLLGKRDIDRLYKFASWCKEKKYVKTLNEFEVVCGLGTKYLSNTLQSPKGSVGAEVMEKVYRQFPTINLTWVVTGDGEMIPADSERAAGLKAEIGNIEEQIFGLIERREELKRKVAALYRLIDLAEEMKAQLKKIPK